MSQSDIQLLIPFPSLSAGTWCCLCRVGQTRGFPQARQAFFQLSYSSSPIILNIDEKILNKYQLIHFNTKLKAVQHCKSLFIEANALGLGVLNYQLSTVGSSLVSQWPLGAGSEAPTCYICLCCRSTHLLGPEEREVLSLVFCPNM